MRNPGIIITFIISAFLFACKPEEILLHGDITGLVTDASTGEPVDAASVKIIQSGDSTLTGIDGTYQFRNINAGQYEIQASKSAFATYKKNATIASAETTKDVDFPLIGIPEPNPSPSFLDFRLDSITLSFSISNSGKGKFTYILIPSQPWITVSPYYGDAINETDNITVTINKTGLSESIYKEFIKVTSLAGLVPLADIMIPVYLNGAMDNDRNYYKVVRIGTQTWMAEDLKTTRYNNGTPIQNITDNTAWTADTTGAMCYYNNDALTYKDTYGALYNWYSVNTGKLCPTGWHVPTDAEWTTLTTFLVSADVAGGKLKETGFSHWSNPNTGATNETGFTALPHGFRIDGNFNYIGLASPWWSSTVRTTDATAYSRYVAHFTSELLREGDDEHNGYGVRCLKN